METKESAGGRYDGLLAPVTYYYRQYQTTTAFLESDVWQVWGVNRSNDELKIAINVKKGCQGGLLLATRNCDDLRGRRQSRIGR